MSLQKYLESKTSEICDAIKERRQKQLEDLRKSNQGKLDEIDREYKLLIEDEIVRSISKHKFSENQKKRNELAKLQHEALEKAYLQTLEDALKEKEFLENLIDSFIRKTKEWDYEWKFIAYGKHAKILHEAAKKKVHGEIKEEEGSDLGGLKAISGKIEIDYSLKSLLEKAEEETVDKVFALLFS